MPSIVESAQVSKEGFGGIAMEHELRQQIAVHHEQLNYSLSVLTKARQELEHCPHNRLRQLRVSLLEASIQIMLENIDTLLNELHGCVLQ